MNLQNTLLNRLSNKDFNEVSKALGYHSTDRFTQRLKQVTESPYLGLDKAGYDFRYSTPQFIHKLCGALEIPKLLCSQVIAEIEAELLAKKNRAFIFLETNFKRTSQPIVTLAVLESKRYLEVDDSILSQSLNGQLTLLPAFIKEHNRKEPSLPVWGEIKQYIYFYDANTVIKFSPTGELIDVANTHPRARAVLRIK